MIEVIQLLVLMVKNVELNDVRGAFNSFTNVEIRDEWRLAVSDESIGDRNVTLRDLFYVDEDDVVHESITDRHGYPATVYNTHWVWEVEFISATSGSTLRWVANPEYPMAEDGTFRGDFIFSQGRPGYFGAYYRAFAEVVQSLS